MFEIGNSLREARMRRQIEFPQAEIATKIRVKYLRALEEERFEQLPSPTYVKGFLRTYSEYLGLDGQLYVDEYNSRFVAGHDPEARIRRTKVKPERRARRLETNIVLIVLTVIAIVTVVVISAWNSSGNHAAKTTTQKRPTHHRPATHPSVLTGLAITGLKGASYVEVHRGGPTGKLLFEGTIGKGKTEPFKGRYFWLNVSSPENLVIRVGGKLVTFRGLKPRALTVTPNGVRADAP